MKKKRGLSAALGRSFEISELNDGGLSSITGGCGPMGGGTNFNCGPLTLSNVEGTAIADSLCPQKTIFTGLKQKF